MAGEAGAQSPARTRHALWASPWFSSISRCSSRSRWWRNIALALPPRLPLKTGREGRGGVAALRPAGQPWRTCMTCRSASASASRSCAACCKRRACSSWTSRLPVLAPQAVEQLFDTLRALAREGTAIIYVSHKLDEIRRFVRPGHHPEGRQIHFAGRSPPRKRSLPRRADDRAHLPAHAEARARERRGGPGNHRALGTGRRAVRHAAAFAQPAPARGRSARYRRHLGQTVRRSFLPRCPGRRRSPMRRRSGFAAHRSAGTIPRNAARSGWSTYRRSGSAAAPYRA